MAVDPENDPRPGDLQYNLLWKILERLTHVTGGGGGGGTPGGVNGDVQFNNAGAFDGASDFLYNSGTGQVSLLSLNVNSRIILNSTGSAAFASGGVLIDGVGNVTVGLAGVHIDGSASFANASTVLAADGAVSFLYGATAFNADGSVDFSGSLDMGSHLIHNVTDPAAPQDAATKFYADAIASAAASAIALKVSKSGDTMTGALNMNGQTFINPDGSVSIAGGSTSFDIDGQANLAAGSAVLLPDGSALLSFGNFFVGSDSSLSCCNGQTRFFADASVSFTGFLDMGSNFIIDVLDPVNPQDAATKAYADTKQAALGFTPENVANKDTDGTLAANSDTKYPSQKAVKTYVTTGLATKQASLGFTPEDVANKSTAVALGTSDTLYSSQKAVKAYIDAVPNRLSAAASGSPYTLTTTAALVSFLTTSPVVTLDKPGTYWISAYASAEFAGATFAAGRVLTIKLRRTNNTAADLTGSGSTFTIPVVTTVTHTMAVITLPPLLYTTANSNDVIEMWASLSALPSAGSMSIRVPTVLQAVRLLTG
jgi:hypothetical protein